MRLNVYVGPYMDCTRKLESRVHQFRTCGGGKKHRSRFKDTDMFCPMCGKPIYLESRTEPSTYYPKEYNEIFEVCDEREIPEESLFNIAEFLRIDESKHVIIDQNDDRYHIDTDLYTAKKSVFPNNPQEQADGIAKFAAHYERQIAVARELYENVEVIWGTLVWYY